VSRIVDQVVEQKMDLIQSKVEDILYKYVGLEKPKRGEKNNGSLEIDTTLMPTDLEQVSPDSDKKSSDSHENKEQVEEEIAEDDDFESPAFEPIEPLKTVTETACQNSHNSNLSEISGLTSQDSAENKSHKSEEPTTIDDKDNKPDTALSQISSTQDNITDITDTPVAALTLTGISGEEAQMAIGLNDSTENENVAKNESKEAKEKPVFQFDLYKDTIEFTGTERKSINLDDSTNSGESEKVIQPQDVQPMEVDNLYENDTTDSSEMRMEIDLKDETTQETANSSKIEESSQDSLKNKDKKSHKRERSKDRKSTSKSSKSHHHHSSSSSKSKHDESSRHKTHSSSHKSSSSHKKSSGDRDRSSSGRKDREKDRKSESSKSSRSKNDEHKPPSDDHQQEKSSRRRRSTDHDSGDSKDIVKSKETQNGTAETHKSAGEKSSNNKESSKVNNEKTSENKAVVVDQMLRENCEMSIDAPKTPLQNAKVKESKSSILVKYDYLKAKEEEDDEKALRGFDKFTDETTNNPWFKCMQLMASNQIPALSNNNYINKRQDGTASSAKKPKAKAKTTDTSGE
jgi:hypothetical protein